LIHVKKHNRVPLSLAALSLRAQFCMGKSLHSPYHKILNFFVRLKINVTSETSRTFGESKGPKVGYRTPLLSLV
jgi:hypothetical protein